MITICFVRVRLCDCSVVEWPLSVAMDGDGEWDSGGDSRFWDLGFYGEIENRKEEKIKIKESEDSSVDDIGLNSVAMVAKGWHLETTNQV